MNSPAWSVIVPTYNRPDQLRVCLAAIARIDPPPGGFEVIVVNDGGTDFDEHIKRVVTNDATFRVRLLSQPHAGPGAARNYGAQHAVGVWLAFTDDDCEPDAGWLRAFDAALAARPGALAGGVVRNAVADNVFSETSQVLASFVTGWFDGARRERLFTTNNIAVARSEFVDVGGFGARFHDAAGEDRDFCDRWSANGRPSCEVPDAIVHHSHVLSLASFLRQHFWYGIAGAVFRRVRVDDGRPIRVDPSFYIASVRHAGRVKPFARGAQLAVCTVVAHAAYAAGLFWETLRRRKHGARTIRPSKES